MPRRSRRRWRAAARRIAARTAHRLLEAANRRRARTAGPPDGSRVGILLLHAYGMGGTIRSVFTTAGFLARTRDVEIVSIVRESEEPFFPIPDGVRVRTLDDRTAPGRPYGVRALLSRFPSVLMPRKEAAYRSYTLWTDVALVRYLRSLRTGVVMGTRPSLNLAMALFTPPGVVTVAQEHVNLDAQQPEVRRLVRRRYPRLDAVVTLTDADLRDYRRELPGANGSLVRIPNALPPLGGGAARLDAKTVIAVGRLAPVKRFDRLITAWQEVAARHPDWTLRIVGSGPQSTRLRTLIEKKGLTGKVILAGRAEDVGTELAQASIFALSSRREGFCLAMVEAMSKGLAVVSFDCPYGPGELITHGYDGVLVPPGDTRALAREILRLIEDPKLRRRLGAQAARTAGRYAPEAVGPRWEALLDALTEAPSDAHLLTQERDVRGGEHEHRDGEQPDRLRPHQQEALSERKL